MRKLWRKVQSMLVRSTWGARTIQYTAFLIGAILSFIWPFYIVSGVLSGLAGAWSIMFAVSALICLLGTLTHTWVGEYVGLWGILPCLVLYAIGCFTDPLFPLRAGFGFLFIGFALVNYSRLQEVRVQYRLSLREARQDRPIGR